MNWGKLARAVAVTQPLAWTTSLVKAELTIYLTLLIADPYWLRAWVYGLAIVLTLVMAPLSAYVAYRIQR